MIILKSLSDRKKLEESGRIVGLALEAVKKEIKVGVTTLYLDEVATDVIISNGGIPAFKNYNGFPFCICASVNEVAVHGFPNNIPIKNGDLIGIDVGVLKNNFYGDAAFTVGVGKLTKAKNLLLTTTKQCLYSAIELCKNNSRVGDISYTIHKIATEKGFITIKNYGGHGVGKSLHEKPHIPNHGISKTGALLKVGMVIAIEPILSIGNNKTNIKEDGWGVTTEDNSLTAHFEHTVMITEGDPKILTSCSK